MYSPLLFGRGLEGQALIRIQQGHLRIGDKRAGRILHFTEDRSLIDLPEHS